MRTYFKRFHLRQNFLWGAARFLRDRRGNIGLLTALLIVPLVGAMGLATEGASWFLINRAAQHAADSVALAAATNNDAAGATCTSGGFISEARAVTSKYGFTDGSNNTTVSVCTQTIAAIPRCASTNCYVVTVTHNTPLLLSSLVGYRGDVALGAGRGTQVQAVAVAAQTIKIINYCDLSLGGAGKKGNAITLNGVSKSQACTFRSEGDVVCNGANTGVFKIVYDDAYSATKCSDSDPSATPVSDPYAAASCSGVDCYGSHIPANTCPNPNSASSYPQETKVNGKWKAAAANQLSGNVSWPAVQVICGDAQLTNDLTVTPSQPTGTVLLIENGVLDLNGHTLQSAGLTIVFSGPTIAGFTPSHIPVDNGGGGILDIAAPDANSGSNWQGVAIWQDANLTSGIDINYTGNSPTWEITGLVYMPNANLSISGSVDQSTVGANCFVLVDQTLLMSGTGYLYSNESGCGGAGLKPPQGTGPSGAVLVY